jgi:hypothetical protein
VSINATQADFPTIDEVVLDAYKKAGLLPIEFGIGSDVQWAAKAAHGRRALNRLLAAHSTHRFFEYFVNLDVVELDVGIHTYALEPDILNIIDDGSYIPASNGVEVEQTTGETPVKPISAARWNQLSGKNSTGTPMYYFIERNSLNSNGNLQLRVWPIPSEQGRIRFRTHRIPGSSSTGSDNPDFKRHWELWAVRALAYELMVDSSMPLDACDRMKRDADEAFSVLKSYDTNNTPPDVAFVHATGWTGRAC